MQELFNIGLSSIEVQEMIERAPIIEDLDSVEIKEAINLLKEIHCNEKQIKNILITNPFYLNKSLLDTLNLIKKLLNIGIEDINLLFDTNPYFFNYEVYEIENYINTELKLNKTLSEIAAQLEDNPFIMNEE